MVVAGDEADATQPTGHEAVEKAAPVDLGLGEGDGDPEHAALAVLVDPRLRGLLALSLAGIGSKASWPSIAQRMAASRTHPLTIWAVDADLLVAGPKNRQGEEQLGKGAERAGAPGFRLCVQKGRGAADLAG